MFIPHQSVWTDNSTPATEGKNADTLFSPPKRVCSPPKREYFPHPGFLSAAPYRNEPPGQILHRVTLPFVSPVSARIIAEPYATRETEEAQKFTSL